MSTSKHAFDQVKSILGKLDRSIDAARARRLEPTAPVTQQAIPADGKREATASSLEIPTARPLRNDTPQMFATPLPRHQPRPA